MRLTFDQREGEMTGTMLLMMKPNNTALEDVEWIISFGRDDW